MERMVKHPTAHGCYQNDGEIDLVVFNLSKFVRLAADANPNILELLFLDEEDILYQREAWKKLREHRRMFLSKKTKHTYTGYAMSQLKRIKGHRSWLLNPPDCEPTRKAYGLPEESLIPSDVRNQIDEHINKVIREWQAEDGLDEYIKGAAQDVLRDRMRQFQATCLQCSEDLLNGELYELAGINLGLTKEVLATIKAERKYRAARKNWQQYERWKKERNEKRAALEAQFGYDTKHASHLIRLLRSGLEILVHGDLAVKRADAQDLIDIRNGLYSYEELMAETDTLKANIDKAYKESNLPKSPSMEDIDHVFLQILQEHDRR